MNKKAIILLFGLFILRSAMIWYGYDRLPLLPNTDEVIINDPALAFSRGEGVVAPSFAGMLDLERAYGIHPPFYMIVQGFIFRLFGFSPLTLRFLGIVSHLAWLALCILVLSRMRRNGWVDSFGFVCVALLLLSEPLTFTHARSGRHDSLAILFGAAGLLCLVPPGEGSPTLKRWLASGTLIGLALATHLQAVLFSVPFAIWAFFHFRKSNRLAGAAVIALPILVLAVVWIMAFGSESLLAWRQLRQHSAVHVHGIALTPWWVSIRDRNVREFNARGGVALLIVMLSWLGMTAAWIAGRFGRGVEPKGRREVLLMCLVSAACHYLLFQYLLGTGAQRVYTALPLAAIGLAASLSLAPRWTRIVAGSIVALLVLSGAGFIGAYLAKVKAEWAMRDPHRLDALVDSLPRAGRIATVPDLWYAFTSRGQRVTIIEQGFSITDRYWKEHPETMSRFDAIILFDGHTYLADGLVPGWPRREVSIPGARYVILTPESASGMPAVSKP